MTIKETLKTHKRPVIYAIVGGINTGVDFLVFQLLYLFTPLIAALCQAISYSAGVGCSFLLNRTITFRDGKHMKLSHQAGRFLLINGISLLVGMVGIELLLLTGMPTIVAKGVITVITAVVNYFGYKVFVFRIGTK